jgi:rhodanese-related sulfurtransferase
VDVAGGVVRGVEELLASARLRIARLEPKAAWAAASVGEALIIDIRGDDDRRRDGVVPGALHIPRTVLEWRIDPSSESRNPHVGGRDDRLLLLCSEGFSSSLAAAALVDLGFHRAGDVIGGFVAWRRAGLPIGAAADRRHGMLAGMGPPD